MEQIIVRHPDGTTALLTSRARKSGVTKAEQSITLLGADTVAITVKSATPLTFHLGDQIDVYGKTYTLNQLPGIKKTGNRNFEYTLTFEGVQYELIDVQFLLPDDTVLDSFTGDLEDFLGILIGNLTRVYPGKWVLGVFPANTEYKTLTYTEKNCLEVLQDFCTQWGTEFEITQANGVRTLNIKTAGVNFPYTFRYGRTGGLYELTRQNINSKNVVTRLYVYGGNSNLGNKYRYSRLCLPGKAKNASYIENAAAIAAYGLKENTKIFDDIRPERYGEVTAAGSAYYAFKDATMNFDLNEKDSAGNTKWLIDGATAKVKFTTGNLAGYEFDIHKYDHATKEIQVVPFTDENGMKFPSETSAAFQFGVGDKYFFTDINLPDAYKTDAENKLLAEGNKAIAEYSQPQVQYGLSIDENFIRQFAGELTVVNLFAVGDYIPVEDEDIGVNKSVRITAFTRDLLREYKYNITLGDSVTKTTITRVIEDLQKIDNVIEINDLADPSKARRNWKASQEVLANVFDPEGHYYSEKIKPLSIETTMLATGARSQQFVLQNTRFEPNYEGNPNTVKVVGGTLVHYTIAETVKSWQLNTATFSNLVSGTVYYIYARCQKTGTAGNIVFDTVQRAVDGDPTYYYFLIGSLSSVITDTDGNRPARLIALTYGATTINGRFLATGRIQSGDGQTYFDLDAGEIGGNIKFRASDGTLKDVAELEQSDIEYLRDAFKDARTEIEGGVALSGFIGVRDTEQNVAAAMAGYNPTGESDYPLIFAGAQQGNVEYYGWTSNSYTHIYTQSATPSNGDNCFDNKGSVVGTVTNIVGAQIFALSTTGETYQRNTGIDFTAKTPSAMEGNRAKFRVYKDGRCVSNYFETSGSYKTIYTKTNCPPLQFTTVLAVSENCYMALTAGAQFGVLMEANEDHNGYNCALYNSSSYLCTVVKGTKSSYTQVGVLSPGELMEFVNIYGTWILRNHTRYSTKAES
jgi:hypothetical protein|nr:MAG: Prophage endopeptidase tail [Bacteriophage sp.]